MKNSSDLKRKISLALAVAAVLAIALGGFYSYRQYRLRQFIAHWRVEGLAADKSGNYDLAVQDMTAYLDHHADDQEALAAFIDARPHVVLDNHAEINQTIAALRNLVRLNPNALDRRVQLLEYFTKVGAQTETIETANDILQKDPANAKAFAAKAQAQMFLKQYKEALATSQAWAKADPMNLTSEIQVIALQGQLSTPLDQIVAGIEAWSKAHPDQMARTEFYDAIAYAATGDREHCRTLLLQAAARLPHDDDLDEALVAQLGVYGNDGEDISVLKQLVQAGAGAKCEAILVRRLWEIGQVQQAVEAGKPLDLNDAANSTNVLAMLGLSYQALGSADDLNRVKAALAQRHEPVAAAWTAIIDSPNARDWKTARSIEDATRQALTNDPNNGYIAYYLGDALANLGENELALETWKRSAGLCQTWGAPLSRMSDLLIEQGDLADAAQVAVAGLRHTPTLAAGLAVARVALALDQSGIQTNRDQAMNLLDQLTKIAPGSEDLINLRARLLCREGQTQQAADMIQNVLDGKSPADSKTPPSESLLLNLADISRTFNLHLEDQIYQADQKLHGITPNVAFNQAIADLAKNGGASGLEVFDGLQKQSADKASLNWELARAQYLSTAGLPAAKSAWLSLSSENPDNPAVQLQVLLSGALDTDRDAALAVIGRLRAILGNNSLVCDMAKARLLVATRSTDADDRDITESLSQIIAAHPSMVEPRVLWARALQQEGRVDDAINQLELAAKIDPTSIAIALQLASLEKSKGDEAAARQQLDRVASLGGASGNQVLLEARLRQSLGDLPGAIAVLKKLTQRSTEEDLLLADLYAQNNQISDADAIVTQLMKNPTPAVLNFASRFYSATGKADMAASALDQLRKMQVTDPELILAEATADLATGKNDQANTLLETATTKYPQNAQLWHARVTTLFTTGHGKDALAVIDQGLAALKSDAALSALKDAGPALVVAMGVRQINQIAIGYVQAPINQPAALDVIQVVAQATGSNDPKFYVSQAQSISQRYPKMEAVQLWTVDQYLRARRTKDAAAAISRLLANFPTSADAAAAATAYYSASQLWNDALDAAKQWRADDNSAGNLPDIAIARALMGLGRPADAAAQLQPLIAQATDSPDNNTDLIMTYGDALYASGSTQQAADLLLPLTGGKSTWRQSCIAFVAQRVKGADAQQWLTKIATNIDPKSTDEQVSLAEAWEAISTRDGADKNLCVQQSETLFASVAAAPDATAEALTRTGMHQERLGHTDTAIALYRRALKLDPSQAVCENNLASLLTADPKTAHEAVDLAKALVAANPNEPEFVDTLASAQAAAGDIDAAVGDLRHAVEIAPEDLRFQISLARMLTDNRRNQEAAVVLASIDTSGADLSRLPAGEQHDISQLRADLAPKAASKANQ
jgi:tetratricopeptide (TPR) repeat protein